MRSFLQNEELNIGILALQGGFAAHRTCCRANTLLVRYPDQLTSCDGLILPGGESTTMWSLVQEMGFETILQRFQGPILATCAGLILLVKLGKLDLLIERNGYGRQIHSFEAKIDMVEHPLKALFIRAPKIKQTAKNVKILGSYQGDPVVVQQETIIAATCHPELMQERTLHDRFLELCRHNKSLSTSGPSP